MSDRLARVLMGFSFLSIIGGWFVLTDYYPMEMKNTVVHLLASAGCGVLVYLGSCFLLGLFGAIFDKEIEDILP